MVLHFENEARCNVTRSSALLQVFSSELAVFLSIFTTKLELILCEIPEKIQSLRPAAVPRGGHQAAERP
jgi:hypothetical protein